MHTPGPWRWEYADPKLDYRKLDLARLVGSNDVEVCNFGNEETYYPTEGSEPEEDDKRLIAAAPEMLEALKLAVSIIGHSDDKYVEWMQSVIWKAEGMSKCTKQS